MFKSKLLKGKYVIGLDVSNSKDCRGLVKAYKDSNNVFRFKKIKHY